MKISYKAVIVTGLVAVATLGTVSAVSINQNHVQAKAGDIPFATGQTKTVPNVTPQRSAGNFQGSNVQVQPAAGSANQFYGASIKP